MEILSLQYSINLISVLAIMLINDAIFSPFLPTPLTVQSGARRLAGLAVATTMCCMSLQVSRLFASSARAQMPAARGAEADVPVWLLVHMW